MTSSGSYKVLLVEDDPGYAQVIAMALEPKVTVQIAGSLRDALIMANGHEAVFLDLGLPDSQGLQTFERIKERFPTKPIVIVTGDSDRAVAFKALKAGARDFLVKGEETLESIERTVSEIVDELDNNRTLSDAIQSFDSCLQKLAG